EFGRFLRDQVVWLAAGRGPTPPPTSGPTPSKVQPGSPLRVPVLGRGGVPASGVSAVSLNVTVTGAEAAGHATVWPCGSPRPTASNVNYVRGATEPNAVLAKVDATGEVCVFSLAPAHVVIDVNGWF